MRNFRLARASLRSHRLRTFLTIIGVAAGVLIISLILIVSAGVNQSIKNQVSGLKNNILVIRSAGNANTGMELFSPLSVAPISTLNTRDVAKLTSNSNIKNVAPMMFLSGHLVGSANEENLVKVIATSDNFPKLFDLKFSEGDWLDKSPLAPEIILGSKLAEALTGDTENTVGQTVQLNGNNFTIAGVIKRVNQPISLAGTDIDKTAFVAPADGEKFLGDSYQVSQIVADTKPDKTTERTIASIKRDLNKDLSIQTGDNAAQIVAGALNTTTNIALIFAGVALFIGGVGVMNIMVVVVIERRHEIGIRKAVGATSTQILTQFLSESLLLTIYGGIIGLVLAYLAAYVIDLEFSLPLMFSWWIFAIGLGVPVLVGLVFGIWPAYRAAKQDPIAALRQAD